MDYHAPFSLHVAELPNNKEMEAASLIRGQWRTMIYG